MPSTPNIIFKTGPNCDCVCVETNCLANRENFGLQLLETVSCAEITDCITVDVAQHELDLDNPNHYGRYCKYYVLENPWDPKWDTETPEPSDYTHKLLEESWQVYRMTIEAREGRSTCSGGCVGKNKRVSFNLEDWDGPGWQFDPTNPVHIYRVLPDATYRSLYARPKGQLPAAECDTVSNQYDGSFVVCLPGSPWSCSSNFEEYFYDYFYPSIREAPSMSFFSSFDDMLDSDDNPNPRSATGPLGERFHPDEKVMVVWEPYTSAMATMPDGTGIDIQSNPGGHRFIPVTHSIYFYYGGIETVEINRWGMRYSNTHRSPAMMFGTLPGICPDLRHYSTTEIVVEMLVPDPNELMSARTYYSYDGCRVYVNIDASEMNMPGGWNNPCDRWTWWSDYDYHSINTCYYGFVVESCEPFVIYGDAPVELGPKINFGGWSRNYFKNILNYGDPIGFFMDIELDAGDPSCCIAGFDCMRFDISPRSFGLTNIWSNPFWQVYFDGDPDTPPIEDHNDFDFVAFLENISLRGRTFYGAVFYLVMTKETPDSNWQTLFYAKMNTPSTLSSEDYSGACWDYQNLEHLGPVGTDIEGRDNVYEYKFIAIPIDTFIDFTFDKSGSTWEGIADDLIALANNPNFNPSSCQIIKSDFNGNTSYIHDKLVLPTKVCVNIYKVDFEDNEWDQDSIDFVESVWLDSEDVFINPTTKYSPTTWVLDNDFLFDGDKLDEVEGCEARLALLSPLGSPCNDPQTSAQIFTSFGVPASAPPDPDCTIEEAEWQAEWNCTTEEWDVTLLSSETKAATATFGNSSSWSITGAGTRAITSYTTDALTAGDILVKYGNPTPVAAGYCD